MLTAGQVAKLCGGAWSERKVFFAEFQAQRGNLPLFGHKRAQKPASLFIQSICPVPGVMKTVSLHRGMQTKGEMGQLEAERERPQHPGRRHHIPGWE